MVSIVRFLSAFILTLALSTGGVSAQGYFEHPLTGQRAPDFTLNSVKGNKVNFRSIRKDKAAVVFFWATWCPHCREQIKALNAKKAELEKAGIEVVYVDIGEDAGTVKAFLNKGGYGIDVLLDSNSELSQTYDVFGIPSLFFIGKDGRIRAMLNGLPNEYMEILK